MILRLVPKPPVQITLRATFTDVRGGGARGDGAHSRRVVPATLELIDRESLGSGGALPRDRLAPPGTGACC